MKKLFLTAVITTLTAGLIASPEGESFAKKYEGVFLEEIPVSIWNFMVSPTTCQCGGPTTKKQPTCGQCSGPSTIDPTI